MIESIERSYIIVFPDNSLMIFATEQEPKHFAHGASCYSCDFDISLEHIRDFIYQNECKPFNMVLASKFNLEW
jgi:hypothetical protein